MIKITSLPKYVLTYIPEGRKGKKTTTFDTLNGKVAPTPMEILIAAKENKWTPVNLRPDPDCPAIIVLELKP